MSSADNHSPTALASWMRGLGTYLQQAGFDVPALFAEQGLDYSLTSQSEARYPVAATSRVWARAVELTGDESLGLKAIRHISPSNFHFLGMGILASQNIRELCQRLSRFVDLITDASELVAQDLPDGLFELQVQVRPGCQPAWQSSDGLIALLANGGRGLGAPELKPEWADLQRPLPKDEATRDLFEKVYACKVNFDQPFLRLVFKQSTVDQPLQGANPGLAAHLDEASSLLVQKIRPKASLSEQLKEWAGRRLKDSQDTSIDAAAAALHMSARNLQRKLAEEQTTFNGLIDEVRRNLAKKALTQTDLPLTHIALDLGFSDVSAFSRACKRWFGVSPSQMRQQ